MNLSTHDERTAPLRRRVGVLVVLALAAFTVFGATPHHVSANWTPTGSLANLGSGRIWQLASAPDNPSIAVAGTDNGVYVSTNGGQSWRSTSLSRQRVWAVGFDARSPHTLYAGLLGNGIRSSTNNGQTWTNVSTGLPNKNVRCFAFSLSGIAAGTDQGVALSNDGTTWRNGGLTAYSISALAVAQNNPSLVFLAGVDRGNVGNGYLYHTDPDGTWSAITSGLPSNAVVSSLTSGPLTASVTQHPIVVATNKGTFRSPDGGASWSQSTGLPTTPTQVALTTVAFSPHDPSLVYGGADAGGSSGGGMFRSTDGGQTFAAFSGGLPGGPPPRQEVTTIAVGNTVPPTVLAGVNPFDSGGLIYRDVDDTAPQPPDIVEEAGGSQLPAGNFTPPPATPAPSVGPSVSKSATNPIVAALEAVFHVPFPLIVEIIVVAAAILGWRAWKKRRLADAPP